MSAPTPGAGLGGAGPMGAPTPYGTAPTPLAPPSGAAPAAATGLPWDWALDFRNVIVEIGPSNKPGTRSPLHFQQGSYDGQQFGYDLPSNETAGSEACRCTLISDPTVLESIPAEYLRPARPTAAGQVVVVIGGDTADKGQQLTTDYQYEKQWMMQAQHPGAMGSVLDGADLCRIWKENL